MSNALEYHLKTITITLNDHEFQPTCPFSLTVKVLILEVVSRMLGT